MRTLLVLGLALATACGPSEEARRPIVVEPPDETPPDETPPDETPPDEPGEPPPAGGDGDLVVGDDPCTTDGDCVPAGCCHPAACVAQNNAPDCGDVMCTTECRFGTLDCGGACLCHEGRCAARLSQPPPGLPTQ